jgi:hypothetical protein
MELKNTAMMATPVADQKRQTKATDAPLHDFD